ncbi:MAG: hypothetical protein AB7U18_21790, partial [Dehalococcoidia bacterium]
MTTMVALPSPAAGLSPPLAVLIEPSTVVCSQVADLLTSQGFRVCIAGGVTDDLAVASLAIVEADRGSRTFGLIRRIHALRPELPIAGVLPWWGDDEADLHDLARFILHVPIRDDQLRGLESLPIDVLTAPTRHEQQRSGFP